MKRKALRIMAGLIAEKRIAITLANSGHAGPMCVSCTIQRKTS